MLLITIVSESGMTIMQMG